LSVVSSFSLCGLTWNGTLRGHQMTSLDLSTEELSQQLALPNLDTVGVAFAGAADGRYYAISNSVAHESDLFLIDLTGNTSKFLTVVKPAAYENLTRYGIANLNFDPRTNQPLAMVVGIDINWDWYCFVGLLNEKTGGFDRVLMDLTDELRTWTYLYDGISAWDPTTGMYYVTVVIGQFDTTTILAYNTSKPGPQSPVYTLPFPSDEEGEGMYQSLAVAPYLQREFNGTLVALVDDIDNTAAAIWVAGAPTEEMLKPHPKNVHGKPLFRRRIPRGSRPPKKLHKHTLKNRVRDPPAPWVEVIQFNPLTLDMTGENNMMVDNTGNAFALFYDQHEPVANQIVVQVDLFKGKEVTRVSVPGSQTGAAFIYYPAQCPA